MIKTRKSRSFMTELLVWVMLLIVLPLAAISVFFYRHELAEWEKIEREKSVLANHTAQKSVVKLGDSILGVTITNGYWEDNRQAILSGDKEWLDKNISDMPDVVPNVDFVAETDLNGKVLAQAGDVREFQDVIQFPVIMQRFEKEKKFAGLVNTSKGIAVIAVSQVTGDKGEGDPAGLLITGRLLTNDNFLGLKDTLQTDIAVLLTNGQFLASSDGIEQERLESYLAAVSGESPEQFRLEQRGPAYVSNTIAPLLDMSGEPIGVIYTELPSRSWSEAAAGLRELGFYSLGIMLLLVLLVITLLRQRIFLPLRHFTAMMEEVAAGKEITPVPKHVQQAEAQIVTAIHRIKEWNQTLERTVQRRTAEIRNLLDNAKQGFMSVGSDLKALGEYSVECTRIFNKSIAGIELPELFYPGDPKERKLMECIMKDYFQERDRLKKELIFSLLPEEIVVAGLYVKVEYKPVRLSIVQADGQNADEDILMVMLTDITETRKLENQMERERARLKLVVHTVTHEEDFAHITQSFEAFLRHELPELAATRGSARDKMFRLYKNIHTFKGNFGYLQFTHTVALLHELESRLMFELQNGKEPTETDVSELIRCLRETEWMAQDMQVLQEALGETFSHLGQIFDVKLTKVQWDDLVCRLESSFTSEANQEWMSQIKQWRYKPIKTLIRHYPAYLHELADRNGLLLHPPELRGSDLPVDPDRLHGITDSLVHIVRNIVSHGIETPEERFAAGKDEYASVCISAERSESGVVISVSDDGRGIDLDAVFKRALEVGLLKAPELAPLLSEEDIAQLVFAEQLSTSGEVTEWSGRGIGLSAVKAEAEKCGGTVKVQTTAGAGTTFTITVPHA
ncbi:ATP-binding protein [Paenibacillus thalictri]|uniref:histidine kinase n=1 Tax=Paenibacillus thalictri TaxID=2527873 RepID=A0A4Q9DLN5_9BACL|nr:ATP-binding protein [Paenibacillus thalictri]TBL75340.1 hypothetical protein EYB31_23310 [Paenibacillus thalictri]